MHPFASRYLPWSIALLTGLADQATKALVVRVVPPGRGIVVIPGLFDLTLVTNPGGIFGILRDVDGPLRRILFSIIPALAIVLILWYAWALSADRRWSRAALGMILGGAAGNLLDRLRLGSVIDFLDVYVGRYHWPAFNLADSCICAGVAMLLLEGIFFERSAGEAESHAPPQA
jgi:signal peptidase II